MKGIVKFFAAVLVLLVPLAGYALETDQGKTASPAGQEEAVTKNVRKTPVLSGKVVETMNGGEYTYIHLDKEGKKTWVAVPRMSVTVGQEIALIPGANMGRFTSKSLNRTFEDIIFSAGPVRQGAKEEPAQKEPQESKAAKEGDKGRKGPRP